MGAGQGNQSGNSEELQRQLDEAREQLERLKGENAASQGGSVRGGSSSAELERQAELNSELQKRLSELEIERKANKALQIENEGLRRSAEQTRILESRIKHLESQGSGDSVSGDSSAALSAEDASELRRLRAELDGQKQRSEKYLLQINDLQTRLRDDQSSQAVRSSDSAASRPGGSANVGSGNAGAKGSADGGAKRKPLFQRPVEQDDLKQVKGIGPVMERTLNDLGVTSFKQLADFTSDDIQMVSDALEVFPGRIERDEWVPQAGELYRKKYLAKG